MPLVFVSSWSWSTCIMHSMVTLMWPSPDSLLQTVYSCVHLIEQEFSVNIIHTFSHISINDWYHFYFTFCSAHHWICMFYPLQSCSTVCGVVAIATALLCQHKEILLKSKQLSSLGWLSTLSKYSDYLRMAIMDWILLETVNTELLGLGFYTEELNMWKKTHTGVKWRIGQWFSDNPKVQK